MIKRDVNYAHWVVEKEVEKRVEISILVWVGLMALK